MSTPDAPKPESPGPRPGTGSLILGGTLLILALVVGLGGMAGCGSSEEVVNCIYLPLFGLIVLGFVGIIMVLVGLARRRADSSHR